MMDSYEECRDPPRLYLLDKFDNAGAGACSRRHSDPSYFKKAWDMMRADKTGSFQREKRSQKIKRNGSRLRESYHGQATLRQRNGEFQRALTAVQLTSRQFASPSTDGRSLSEHRSTPDARSNPDNISRSSSFSSKARLSFVEQASDTKATVVPHENGHDKPSNINLHKLNNNPLPTRLNSTWAADLGDDLKQSSLPDEMIARPPSVKWDEKAEITMSTTSVYCDDVVMDKAEDAEAKCISPEQQDIDYREMETLEQQEALLQKTKLLLVSSDLNHHDEVPSETDNYMDALNTLESETETEPELQTKNQVMPVPSFNVYVPQVELTDYIVIQSPDSSVAEFPDTCQNSGMPCASESAVDFSSLLSADVPDIPQSVLSGYTAISLTKESPIATNTPESNTEDAPSSPSEISELALRAFTTTVLNQNSADANEIPESKAEDVPIDSPEKSEPGQSVYAATPPNKEPPVECKIPDSNAEYVSGDCNEATTHVMPCSKCTISGMPNNEVSATKSSLDDTTDESFVMSERRPQDYPGKNNKVESDDTLEVSNSHSMPLNELLENGCVQGLPTNAPTSSIGVSSVKLWTNAGLFGLEPSKPPVFGAHDGPKDDTAPGYKEPQLCHSIGYTELHCSKPIESALVDASNGNALITSSFVGRLVGICPGSANHTISEANHSTVRTPDTVCGQTEGSSGCSTSFELSDHKNNIGKQTSISELLESEDKNGVEMYSITDMDGRNNMNLVSASSFSSIAQRFLANTLQRRTSPKYIDLPMSSGIVNTDANGTDESTQKSTVLPSETVFEVPQFEKKTESSMNGRPKSSLFSSCHYSEKSSPPLEYMKISFHPMSAVEMSKLNLDFSDGNLHENADDMMLPTFQLLPGSSIPHPGSGSESEDDTFGRSYSYSSYDDLSPRLYSNSELWDQEDATELEDHEMYNNPNRIGSFRAPTSSFVEFEQMNLSGAKSTVSLADLRDNNGLATLNSHPAGELPNFETLMATCNNQNGDAFIPHNPVSLSPDEDHLPPPPPLPPMQWRTMTQTASIEEGRGSAAKDMHKSTSGQSPAHTPVQEEHIPPIALPDEQEHAKENASKVDMVKEICNPPNIIEIKASFLQQIRDKSGQQKLNGHEKSKAVGNDTKNSDERGELLQQIRSKTFNLRQTNASKANVSSQSTANSNVVAILEKANAIRQAVASDDGGDDDNWSDK
ncbi:hypothetical protein GUJ93_ZPchr0001g31666 [Zizania palustris]|uniref:Protein SCAR n=1 Tax=Zizania palustris TaxID=103762 RepID=A0A8J5RN70_ZIZPA|nr:hypothetical protein GUJ93_ZPchr0001g31666 [Zizania palustris]KAG8052978.1 hypothetical protein GUJ93_ZPchr0001g31666 [Zizania palustris]